MTSLEPSPLRTLFDPRYDKKLSLAEIAAALSSPAILTAAALAIALRVGAPPEHSDSFEPIAKLVLDAVIPLIALAAHDHYWLLSSDGLGHVLAFPKEVH